MKIGNSHGAAAGAGVAPTTSREAGSTGATAKNASASAPAAESTKVQLSSTASALLEGSEGGFDADKVNKVRQSISDGTYKINPEAIADKLIANAQEVLGKVSSAR